MERTLAPAEDQGPSISQPHQNLGAMGRAPRQITLAMSIAIGGSAVSCAACVWVAAQWYAADWLSELMTLGALTCFVFNLALVGLNWALFAAIRRRSRKAWTAVLYLVLLGALFDVVGQLTWFGTGISVGAGMFAWTFGSPSPTVFLVTDHWLWVHLLLIQVPLLALLLATPSRRWVAAQTQGQSNPS